MKNKSNKNEIENFNMHPIGYVRESKNGYYLEILESYRPALKQLDQFSHVMVFWWAHKRDDDRNRAKIQTKPPYAKDKLTGVFACRAEYRPNPIAVTTCRIFDVDEDKGTIQIPWIDAYSGTPIVDLKAYFPVCDRVKEPQIPEWLSDWPDWMPEGDDEF